MPAPESELEILRALNARFIHNFVTNDVASHDAILHPRFVCIGSNGARRERAPYLRAWAHGFDADTPASVIGDAGRLRQVLLNLLSNAVKFTAKGGVTASLMRVGGDAASPRLRVEIIDTGAGIAEAKQAGIFKSATA